jgi:hypothetical protein
LLRTTRSMASFVFDENVLRLCREGEWRAPSEMCRALNEATATWDVWRVLDDYLPGRIWNQIDAAFGL